MNALIVGDWEWDIYEKALADGLSANKINVDAFAINNHIKIAFAKLQKKLKTGPTINRINRDLLNIVHDNKYDFLFFQRPDIIKKSTIQSLKKNSKIICYHNDNPFHQKSKYLKYRHYFSILPLSDLVYVYRPSNIEDAKKFGAKNVRVLMPYYVKGLHNLDFKLEKEIDVIFIGHFENDGRADFCEYLLKSGINLKIIGPFWEKAKGYKNIASLNIKWSADGDNYVKTIKQAKIALVFLSKYNKDVYTRRCFEIPAIGTFMLAPETNELKKIYKPKYECEYYNSKEELLEKTLFYLKNDVRREAIAAAGYRRVIDSESNIDRAKQIIEDVKEL